MKQPRITDDGTTVTIDLHGVWVDRAIEDIRRLVSVAAERGRPSLRIIHGSSTSDVHGTNRTIKHELHRALDSASFPEVASDFRDADTTVLALDADTQADRNTITLFDLRRE
ncbi:MAG: Smr/MutS family protein [Rubricoccaceae bacterium]|nr:Smr/MutS family protein [Rubricoccaceae bacterium]